jgi:3',5'-cyclic-nucleotide phosphodiesterase
MKLRVLGCHGGTSIRHRNVSFLIDGRVAMDAGALAMGLTLEEQVAVESVLLSHSHLDHVADLGAMADLSQQAGTQLAIHGLIETIDALRNHFFNNVLWPDFTVIPNATTPTIELRDTPAEEPFHLGNLEVQAIRVDHSVPSCGYLVKNGRVALGYTGDTGPTERFWELAGAVPELAAVITELSYPSRMDELANISGHLTPFLFEEQIARLGRREVPIFVYGMKPLFEDEIKAELAQVDRANVHVLEPGEEIEL